MAFTTGVCWLYERTLNQDPVCFHVSIATVRETEDDTRDQREKKASFASVFSDANAKEGAKGGQKIQMKHPSRFYTLNPRQMDTINILRNGLKGFSESCALYPPIRLTACHLSYTSDLVLRSNNAHQNHHWTMQHFSLNILDMVICDNSLCMDLIILKVSADGGFFFFLDFLCTASCMI